MLPSIGTPRVAREVYGTMPSGETVERITLRGEGITVSCLTLGCIIDGVHVPDRDGDVANVVLGYDRLDGYLADRFYFGAVVGRYGNRIAQGRFTLDGETYRVTTNDGEHHLHGGARGFSRQVWQAEVHEDDEGPAVTFTHTSPAFTEGYPGTVMARVRYALTGAGALTVSYAGETDAPTPLNLTQHSYFNLSGDRAGDVCAHSLQLAASRFTPVDASLIPTGALQAVEGSAFDFRTPRAIGEAIDAGMSAGGAVAAQLGYGAGGFDHNFVFDAHGAALADAPDGAPQATLHDARSGRTMTVHTTEPGVQLWTGNSLDASVLLRGGAPAVRHAGLALETQHFPDTPNQPGFPSTIVRPGTPYSSQTRFTFQRG